MDDDEDTPSYDYFAPEVQAARDAVGRAISEYLRTIHPDEEPFVVAWVVGAEWTNAKLEQSARAGRDIISPAEQSISASGGLGAYVAARFA